jgi:hypothetical protein
MMFFGEKTNLRGALVGILIGAATLPTCLAGCADNEISTTAEGASGRKADLPIPSLSSAKATSKGGASGGASGAVGGSGAGANGDNQPPAPNPTCTDAAQCASGFCVDGVCCNEACSGTCVSCNQAQSPGTCMPVSGAEDASANTPCTGVSICTVSDGQPACRLKSRAICATNGECASGSCGSIVVSPDPADPYDVGYTYVGCK